MTPEKERIQFLSWFVMRPKTTGLLVFLIFFVVSLFMVFQRYLLIRENDRREMNNIIRVVYRNLDQSLKNSVTAALTLALTIDDEGTPQDFEEVAQKILASNPGIDAVQLVPDGIIKYVYPVQENAAVLGFDVLNSSPHRAEALKSIESRNMYFAGPMKLRQGGMGVVGRLPVFIGDRFWGFSAVIIKLETLIKTSGINALDDSRYYFQLSKSDSEGETFFLPGNTDFKHDYHEVMTYPQGDWNLYLVPKDPNDTALQLIPLTFLGMALSILLAFLITVILRKPAELQKRVYNQARKLLKSEVRFKAIFDHAPLGMAHIDAKTEKFLEVNDTLVLMTGYIPDELKRMGLEGLTHQDDRAEQKRLLDMLVNGESRGFSMEKRILANSGEFIWVNCTASPLWGPGDAPTSFIAILEDVTLKKEAKEQIAKSEAHFKSLFEDSPVALWEEDFSAVKQHLESLDLLGRSPKTVMSFLRENPDEIEKCISLVRILDVNNECVVLNHPKTKQELLGVNLANVLDEESRQAFIRQVVAITSGVSGIAMDTRLRRESGEVLDIHLRWGVMRGYEQSLGRVIISAEDVTAQKESQRLVSSTQKRIETLVNTIDGIVWESDYDSYNFTFVNKKAEEITGYSISQWVGDPSFWSNTIHPEDREWAVSFCAENSQIRRQYSFEYRMIHKDGSIIWIRDIVNVIHENGKPVSLRGIMIDITKTKEAEQDLNKSLELVTEQNERLHNFSYIVSHNLRSHTANIQSIATLIEMADSDQERLELIGMLKTVSGSLNDTMLHLNDLLNIKANIGLGNESLNLRQYIDNTLSVLQEQLTGKNVQVDCRVPDLVEVNYNPAYLESILLNLISNAIRYSTPGRDPKIEIDWKHEHGRNALTIADNGIGIDLQKHGDKLFGMYKTFNGNPDARGIGLFITRNQIEAMGGSISVESEPGLGTTFTIYFL